MTTKAKNRLSQSYQSSPCFTFRRLPSVASGKQYYEVHDGVFNWAGSTLAVPDFGPVYGVHLTGLIADPQKLGGAQLVALFV